MVAVDSLDELPPLPAAEGETQIASITPMPAAPQGDDIFVQVGAYSQIGSASRVMTNVSHIGDTGMESIMLNGRKLYRVRVGPIYTETLANSALQQILKLGHNTAKVVYD